MFLLDPQYSISDSGLLSPILYQLLEQLHRTILLLSLKVKSRKLPSTKLESLHPWNVETAVGPACSNLFPIARGGLWLITTTPLDEILTKFQQFSFVMQRDGRMASYNASKDF